MTLTVGSLFAGIGGFDLAAEAMGWTTAWYSEIDPYCCQIMREHFPRIPNLGDIKTVDFSAVERPDILCAGFPCQPSSVSGKQLGTKDPRWLWPHVARAVGALRPRWLVCENVPGLLRVNSGGAFEEILRDLASLGYDAEWSSLSAADVGAPHKRQRIWILAYPGRGEERGLHVRPRQSREEVADAGGRIEELVDAASRGWGAGAEQPVRRIDGGRSELGNADLTPARRDAGGLPEAQGWYRLRRLPHRPWDAGVPLRGADGTVRLIPRDAADEGPESSLWPVAPRLPGRVAQLKAVGNAIVPECAIQGPFAMIAALLTP